jgi:hypothetical protein
VFIFDHFPYSYGFGAICRPREVANGVSDCR